MKKNLIGYSSVLFGLGIAVSLAGCGNSGNQSTTGDGAYSTVIPGTLTECADSAHPPFEAQMNGEFVGYNIDVMKKVADGLGLKWAVKATSFDSVQSGVAFLAGQCDFGVMSITPERGKRVDFTDGFYDNKQSLLVESGSAIHSIDDLGDKAVGVLQGQTGAAYANSHVPKGTRVITFPSDSEAFQALKAKSIDAILDDIAVNLEHAKDGKYVIVGNYSTGEKFGFATKKGNEKLVKAVDEQFAKMKSDGTLGKLSEKYFGTDGVK